VVTGEALGTTWTIKFVEVGDADHSSDVQRVASAALAEVDAAMSTWRDDSDLSRVRAAGGPTKVSEETWSVVRAAVDLAQATGGAFDPTVQPLVELWGIHGDRRTAAPTDDQVAAVLKQVGWHKVLLGRSGQGEPTIDGAGTALDLSAIAKGHAVDRVSAAVSALGLGAHMVEVGGEVRVHGLNETGDRWRVGIDWPEAGLTPGERLFGVVQLTNGAVATSGNYRNAYEVDGVHVVHTLDPRVGRPVESDVASVTVVAPDCRTADGWATALMVLGSEGLVLLEGVPDVHAVLVGVPQGADVQTWTSPAMANFLVELQP
jgi:thiamine biosynthesis lipoprotein